MKVVVKRVVNVEFMDGLKHYVKSDVYMNGEAVEILWHMYKDKEVTPEELGSWSIMDLKSYVRRIIILLDRNALAEILLVTLARWNWEMELKCFVNEVIARNDCFMLTNNGEESIDPDMLVLYREEV